MPIREIKILENLLNYSSLKQKVISENIANTETIGYKRRDVDFKDLLDNGMKSLSNLDLKKTDFQVNVDKSTENVSGVNNVDINKEMAEMAQNSILFRFAARKLNAHYSSLQSVIKGGAGR